MEVLNKKGISLVETLIAVAIMAILMIAVTSLLVNTSKSEKRNKVLTEVEYQAGAIMYEIAQSIRNASAVTSPAVGSTSTELTLALASIPAQNPTIFSISALAVLVSRGGSGTLPISSGTVEITNLTFQNISALGTKGAVRVSFTVSATNPNNKPELAYSTTRVTTVTLR